VNPRLSYYVSGKSPVFVMWVEFCPVIILSSVFLWLGQLSYMFRFLISCLEHVVAEAVEETEWIVTFYFVVSYVWIVILYLIVLFFLVCFLC
jgi:hypothetical protein